MVNIVLNIILLRHDLHFLSIAKLLLRKSVRKGGYESVGELLGGFKEASGQPNGAPVELATTQCTQYSLNKQWNKGRE